MAITFPTQGYSAVAQNFISRGITSNFYSKSAILAVLGAQTLGNTNKTDMLTIGRPNGGEILSGGMVSPAMKKKLTSVNRYSPRVQGFETTNTAGRTTTGLVALPDVASKTTTSHAQALQYAAQFGWTHIDTPILIWHEYKIRAGQEGTKEGANIAMGQLIDEATQIAMQDQLTWLATKLVSGGSGVTQTDDLWSEPLGLDMALTQGSGTYAGVNRATAGNSVWDAQKDTTTTFVDIKKIIDDANLTKNIRVKGNGINTIITTTALYSQFKQQVLAGGGIVLQNGLPEFGKMGIKKEVLQIDNVHVTYDPNVAANNVYALDTTVWKFILHPDYNFKVTEFVDNTKTGIAKDTYDYAYISTRFILACDNPFLNVRYTAIGT